MKAQLASAAILSLCIGYVAWKLWDAFVRKTARKIIGKANYVRTGREASEATIPDIIPVAKDFDWSKVEPRKYRPFKKGPHFMTMGIQKCDFNDWLLLENTYKDITKLRADIVENNRDHTVLSHPMANDALRETYDWLLDYMVQKYPMYFVRSAEKPLVHNKINNVTIPGYSSEYGDDEIDDMIRTLAKNIEEDFLVLMFDQETDQYYLRGGSFAFPSGFDPAVKLNLPLKDVHGPVPMYKEKLQVSMDRYFKKLKTGTFVQRYNWGIQAHTELYAPGLNHTYDENLAIVPFTKEELDFDQVWFRSERQILTRLPKTGHLLFTIRTYTVPLTQIKQEDRTEDLIEAINNLPVNMARYKNALKWGPAVKKFLSGD